MTGAYLAAELLRFYAFVVVTRAVSHVIIKVTDEIGAWALFMRGFVAVLVATGLGYF